jgi:predicted Zn finger-like uncharacterized protein
MKVKCPDCDAIYTISDHRIAAPAAKVLCPKCGARLAINKPSDNMTKPDGPSGGESENAVRHADPAPPEPQQTRSRGQNGSAYYSVASLSPKVPKYRNPLIIIAVVLILAGLLAGVHFAVQGAKHSVDRFFQDPVAFVADMFFGADKMKLCASFLDRNQDPLAVLGKDLKYFPIREETRVTNGRETATVVIRVQGSRATKDVIFGLEERKGEWEIVGVILDLGRDQHQRLYP